MRRRAAVAVAYLTGRLPAPESTSAGGAGAHDDGELTDGGAPR